MVGLLGDLIKYEKSHSWAERAEVCCEVMDNIQFIALTSGITDKEDIRHAQMNALAGALRIYAKLDGVPSAQDAAVLPVGDERHAES